MADQFSALRPQAAVILERAAGSFQAGEMAAAATLFRQTFAAPPHFEQWTDESAWQHLQRLADCGAQFFLVPTSPGATELAALGVGIDASLHPKAAELISRGVGNSSYYFAELAVAPAFRRYGLGGALQDVRERYGRDHGYDELSVRARADSEVVLAMLYKRGFIEKSRYTTAIEGSLSERVVLTRSLTVR